MKGTNGIRLGIDVLLDDPSSLRGLALGLVVNPASVTSDLVPAQRALSAAGLEIKTLFGPEHGLTGAAQDMIAVADGGDPRERARIVSLYGSSFADLSPKTRDLEGLDAVICDLPDVGSRYYTFVWTTALVMKACAAAGIPVWVLDRPNPLGGVLLEGNLPEEPLLSFVGLYPVPVRHGMTPAELARWVNEEFGLGCDLHVVPMRTRGRAFDDLGAWVLPSPNMPSPSTALVYPGACLFEGTNLSEGRGTTRPFELVGAPWLDPEEAARRANDLGLPGVVFRPHVFRPTFHKHAGLDCGGVQTHVTDPWTFRSFETGLRLVQLLRDLQPSRFRWRTETYEFRDDVPAIDLLAGSPLFRGRVDRGHSLDPWIATFEEDLVRFRPSRERALLYGQSRGGAELPPILHVVGAQDSGKTRLMVALVEALVAEGIRVGTIKHTRHDHETDVPGKDSQRHAEAGADPAVLVAGSRVAVHRRAPAPDSLRELAAREMSGVDVVLVEGCRDEPGPKVEVVRAATGREPVAAGDPGVVAVVGDRPTAHPAHVPRLATDDLAAVLAVVRSILGPRGRE